MLLGVLYHNGTTHASHHVQTGEDDDDDDDGDVGAADILGYTMLRNAMITYRYTGSHALLYYATKGYMMC